MCHAALKPSGPTGAKQAPAIKKAEPSMGPTTHQLLDNVKLGLIGQPNLPVCGTPWAGVAKPSTFIALITGS
jgi:hypothetical protein